MAALIFPALSTSGHPFITTQLRNTRPLTVPIPLRHLSTLTRWPLRCTKSLPWESSSPYSSIIKGGNIIEEDSSIIEAEESTEFPLLGHNEDITNTRNLTSAKPQLLKWTMWLIGPSILLATGMLPTLWLPLSSVFLGPNIAGLLSLLGLDCIFNIGATLFLLMADACARSGGRFLPPGTKVPLFYRLWNMGASLLGFLAPFAMLLSSRRGLLVPELTFVSFAVLLGPYLLLLSIQMLTEMLTWHWESPVWLVTPIVYEAYRILQLMRGLKLGSEVGAPGWAVDGIRLLVSWWVLILGIQIMRVAWFAGLDHGNRSWIKKNEF